MSIPRAMPAVFRPSSSGPALWQQPSVFGAAAVGIGIAAFPVAAVFGSEYAGLALAGLAAVLGAAGTVLYFLYRVPSPVLALIGLAIGGAIAFGLAQDIKRADMVRQANSVADTLAQVEKTQAEVEALKNKTDELKKQADDAFSKAEEQPKESKKILDQATEKEEKAKKDYEKAKDALDQVVVEKQKAEQKEKDALAKEKDIDKKIEGLAQLEKDAQKADKDAKAAQAKASKDKEEVDKKLDEAKKLLDEAKETQKKTEDAVKLLMSKLKDPDPAQRIKATQGIAKLGPDAPPAAAVALCEATMHPDMKLKQEAFLALHKVRPDLYVPVVTLVKSLKFNQDGVNVEVFAAAKKLGDLGKAAAPTAPIFGNLLTAFLDLKTPTAADVDTAKFLLTGLGKIAATDPETITMLGKVAVYKIDMTKEGEDALRHEARTMLFQMGTSDAPLRKQVVPLLAAGLKEKKVEHRIQICEWLGSYGADAKPAVPELEKLLADGDMTVNIAANKALNEIKK